MIIYVRGGVSLFIIHLKGGSPHTLAKAQHNGSTLTIARTSGCLLWSDSYFMSKLYIKKNNMYLVIRYCEAARLKYALRAIENPAS